MTPTRFVVVWREAPSTRLRTYVEPVTNYPFSYTQDQLAPPPSLILTTEDELAAFLSTPPAPAPEPTLFAAVPAQLAHDYLGWDPIPFS